MELRLAFKFEGSGVRVASHRQGGVQSRSSESNYHIPEAPSAAAANSVLYESNARKTSPLRGFATGLGPLFFRSREGIPPFAVEIIPSNILVLGRTSAPMVAEILS